MALRLTEPVDPAPDTRPGSLRLRERGQARLAAGDLSGWRALFDEATGIEDVHDRYRARRGLLADGLSACKTLPLDVLPRTFLTLARCGVEQLEREPREPVILNQTGVALYELGSNDAAETCFHASLALAPELPDPANNLKQIAARRRRGRQHLPLDRNVRLALTGLSARAPAAAKLARPAEGLRLSLCMIVKDEQEMLPQCLAAVAQAVDEIVVVDTGSSDTTIDIARSYGARVIEMEWTGSFAEPRNASFDAATGDWLLYLDADEVLVAADVGRLRALTGQVWREAIYLVETNHTGAMDDGTAVTHNAMRMFRNRPEYRFEGRIHEQIANRLPGDLPERFAISDVRVEHFGYLSEVRAGKAKSSRNIELLQRQIADGCEFPFLHFNLGSEYAAAGDGAAALTEFLLAWEGIRANPDVGSHGFVPSLVSRLVRTLRIQGRIDDAERQAEEGLELFEGFTDLVYEQARCARQRGEPERAAALLRRCLEMGDAPSRYSSTVGCGTYLATLELAELSPPGEAVELLERCLSEHPRYLGTVLPLTEALLASGVAAEEVARRVGELAPADSASARFMIGTAIYEAGHPACAEGQFRAVLEAVPGNGPALLAVGECLLSRGDFAAAAAVAAEVSDDSPCAAAAVRSQAFAALADGDLGATAEALDRARKLGLSADLLDLLEAWERALVSEGRAATLLPASTAATLTSFLEALLRIAAVDAFVTLVGLVETLELPWRERRELLAATYLRRGFLDSAADEWIAVCERDGPDAAALVGLAQVALARGLEAEAHTFADEALVLSPGDPRATRLVAAEAVG